MNIISAPFVVVNFWWLLMISRSNRLEALSEILRDRRHLQTEGWKREPC